MAKMVLTNGRVLLNAVDLSTRAQQVEITYKADVVDDTAFNPDNVRTHQGGLRDWSATVKLTQDYAAGSVDATMFALVGSTIPVAFRAVNGTIADTNPEFQGNAVVESYQPLSGEVGGLHVTQVSLRGTGILVRDVIP